MAVTDDRALADRIRLMSLHGLSNDAWARYSGGRAWDYRILAPGFKYNMTDIAAALGLVQLTRADAMREARARNRESYREGLAGVEEVELPRGPREPDPRVAPLPDPAAARPARRGPEPGDRLPEGRRDRVLGPLAAASPPSLLRGLVRLASGGSPRRDPGVGAPREPSAVPLDDTRRDRNRDAYAACSLPAQRALAQADRRRALMQEADRDAGAPRAGGGLPRAADVVLALAGLALSLPVLALAGLAVALSSKGPVLFRQERVGRHGVGFLLLKLRTMRQDAVGPAVTAGGDPRVTPVGRFLRRSKIDELPQLWNVLSGEMALVGPRPEVPEYVDSSDPGWRRVLEVRPGMTDPVSLRLRFEEDLLASVAGDRCGFLSRRHGSLQGQEVS